MFVSSDFTLTLCRVEFSFLLHSLISSFYFKGELQHFTTHKNQCVIEPVKHQVVFFIKAYVTSVKKQSNTRPPHKTTIWSLFTSIGGSTKSEDGDQKALEIFSSHFVTFFYAKQRDWCLQSLIYVSLASSHPCSSQEHLTDYSTRSKVIGGI